MPILTRDIIDDINDYRRYSDLYWTARVNFQTGHEAAFKQLSIDALAQVTDEQLAAYEGAGIEPPHKVGNEQHRQQVDAYFESAGV